VLVTISREFGKSVDWLTSCGKAAGERGIIVDCSIVMAWLFHDEATPKTTALLNRVVVPAWSFIEITNFLAMAAILR